MRCTLAHGTRDICCHSVSAGFQRFVTLRSCHLQLLTPTPSLSLLLHLSLSLSHSLCPDEFRSFPNASSAAATPLLPRRIATTSAGAACKSAR